MSFFLAKLLTLLAMPLGLGCALLLVALWLVGRRPWACRLAILASLVLVGALGTGAVARRLVEPLETAFPAPGPEATAEAAVVLAGTVNLALSTPERVEFYDRPERIIEGARLVKAGRARWLVISGGSGDPRRPDAVEAEFLARTARELGVDPAVILIQGRSRTTREDALYTAPLLKERGLTRFFLVTSAFHLPRAVALFRQQGLDPIPYPVDHRVSPDRDVFTWVPAAWALELSTLAVHERLGLAVYRALGYL
ncbi:MAG: YdcF family protein [Deferrisomatales bacterium]